MNEHPLVSVITCTYNRAHLLPRAIQSLLDQTYRNFELIIIDDGSTDNTEEVVKSYNDKRIFYHKQNNNKGVAAAVNTGFDLARGEYICRLDSDDELIPEALEVAISRIIELSPKGIKIVWYNAIDVETGKISGSGINKEGDIEYKDLLCNKIHGDFWGMMHKDYIGENRLDERLIIDVGNFWLRVHRESKGYYVPRVLYKAYRQHGSSRLNEYLRFIKYKSIIALGLREKLEEFGDEIKSNCPAYYGTILAQLGYLQIIDEDKFLGRKTLAKSFEYTFSLKYIVLYLLSFILGSNQMIFLYSFYCKLREYRRRIVAFFGVI